MKRVRTYKILGKTEITYISDCYSGLIFNGEYLDTEVNIEGIYICTIAGNTIFEFHEKLEEIIEKYKI